VTGAANGGSTGSTGSTRGVAKSVANGGTAAVGHGAASGRAGAPARDVRPRPHAVRDRAAAGIEAVAREVRRGVGGVSRVAHDRARIAGLPSEGRHEPSEAPWAEPSEAPLSGEWARYVGVIEALASPLTATPDDEAAPAADRPGLATAAASVAGHVRALTEAVRTGPSPVPLSRTDLPDWVLPTDVLVDAADADDAQDVARDLGLPRVADSAQAWAALGALGAIVRIVDDGRRTCVVVDESGVRSPLSRWARAVGFAPVSLGLNGARAELAAVDLDVETLDVITRLHPGGCDSDDIDELVGLSAWLLRPGGLLIVTLPLGPPAAPGALAPADVRGVVARAHGFGLVLVGDLDGELTTRMAAAVGAATSADTAYGLVRLTFRRT
ncbi:MAG: hypothetical protein ABI890_07030, partial [Lapillicoccus sp.]